MKKNALNIACLLMIVTTFAMMSCERESWSMWDDANDAGKTVNVLLSYNIPSPDMVVTTRSSNVENEHNLSDLFVFVFYKNEESDAEEEYDRWEKVSGTYFSSDDLSSNITHYSDGTWKSIIDNPTAANSTHGTVMVKAKTGQCLIYAVANIDSGEACDANKNTLLDDLQGITSVKELYDLRISLNDDDYLSRGNNLFMSGVFVAKGNQDKYAENYVKGTAGLVSISDLDDVDANGNGYVNLTQAGVINLRRLSSHITFKISVNSAVFSDFKPESWQVVNIPQSSYLMDQGNATPSISDDSEFIIGEVKPTMLHTEGKYQFDFFMYENRKEPHDISGVGGLEVYRAQYGNTIQDVNLSNTEMLFKYKNALSVNNQLDADEVDLFRYAKRELPFKEESGNVQVDAEGRRKFVYADPNATYVKIKGRLNFNTAASLEFKNLITGSPDTEYTIADSYADVTYFVHLGYVGNDVNDFNSLRNTQYTYNIEIRNANSIYTHVTTEDEDRLMTGASGFVGLASRQLYKTDCHFNAFVIRFDKTMLNNEEGLLYEINTPFHAGNLTPDGFNENEPDYTWVKFRFNGVKCMVGNQVEEIKGIEADGSDVSDLNLVKDYKNIQHEGDSYDDYNVNGLMNLQQLSDFIEANKVGWNEHFIDNDETALNYEAFFTVYLDEYYYEDKDWTAFVNKPARYISFGSSTKQTKDQESSMITPYMMIVQSSIQTHFSSDATRAYGMEHVNETKDPRWHVVNANDDGAIPTTGFSATNGWSNSWRYVENVEWSQFVSNEVDATYNNLRMRPSVGALPLTPETVTGETDGNTDNPYKASAIRLCMNRNRDENGNGVIDEDEMKWYLPSSIQLDFITLCHFSYEDPLLDFNRLYNESQMDDTYGNQFVYLPEGNYSSGYNINSAVNYTYYTYITSDYKKVATQEMSNTKFYSFSSQAARPGEMRCVRNLGDYSTNSDEPDLIYTFDNNRFQMKNLDSRSLRSVKVVGKELDSNTNYDEENRPYKNFKVAKNLAGPVTAADMGASNVVLHTMLRSDRNPCRTYAEDGEPAGTWRAPNLTELSLMIFHDNLKTDNVTLLPTSGSPVYACNTAWSFTPNKEVWGRAFLSRRENNMWSTTLTNPSYSNNHWQETFTNAVYIRCVKDVDP